MSHMTADASLDRYRAVLKGTWKDEAGPACGQTYDLGSHLIDQTLVIFGRPRSLTAFIENARNIGDPDVDDSVGLFNLQRGSSHDLLP
jgi:predicted dehydrogenase